MSTWIPQARVRLPQIAETAMERARLTVVPRRRTPAPRVPFVILVAVVLLGGVVGLLMFNTSMQQASFKATALQAKATELQAKEQQLQMKLDKLRDPQRVAARATELGMVPVANPAFLNLGNGAVLGAPVAASSLNRQRISPLPTRRPAGVVVDAPAQPPAAIDALPGAAAASGVATLPPAPAAGTNEPQQ